jgi:hypothetical protein
MALCCCRGCEGRRFVRGALLNFDFAAPFQTENTRNHQRACTSTPIGSSDRELNKTHHWRDVNSPWHSSRMAGLLMMSTPVSSLRIALRVPRIDSIVCRFRIFFIPPFTMHRFPGLVRSIVKSRVTLPILHLGNNTQILF